MEFIYRTTLAHVYETYSTLYSYLARSCWMEKDLCAGSMENHDQFHEYSLYEMLGEKLVGIIADRWYLENGDKSRCLPVSYVFEQFKKMHEGGEIEIVSQEDFNSEHLT